jgi:D-alanine-D-alanine ligase
MSRVLILSAAVDRGAPPDACVDDVIAELYTTLSQELGYDVANAAVTTASEIEHAVRAANPTIVLNLCESLAGTSRGEAVVPNILERLGVAYTGSACAALRTCLQKLDCNETLERAGVPVPYTRRLASGSELVALPLPAIVKPDREDGSVGIDASSVVHDLASARSRVDALVAELGQPAVVQEYVEGREISVSFLGYPSPRALSPGEIAFDSSIEGSPPILTYAAKWYPESVDYVATRPVPAAAEPTSARKIVAVARRAFETLGLRDYGRIDMRIDHHGCPRVIDVNPNCDLGHEGAFMRAARRSGLDRAETLSILVRGAFLRAGTAAA